MLVRELSKWSGTDSKPGRVSGAAQDTWQGRREAQRGLAVGGSGGPLCVLLA